MDRFSQFRLTWGPNWLVGRKLLPELTALGQGFTGDVLDLACGESPFRSLFAQARQFIRVDRLSDGDGVLAGDLYAIPLADQSVDLVLLLQAITDVPEPWRVLAEVRRVLRPGGRLIIFESVSYPEHDAPWDYYRLMPQGLRHWAGLGGYRVDQLRYLGGFSTRLASGWNKIFLGRLVYYPILRPLGYGLTLLGNMMFYCVSLLERDGPRASDYLAILSLGDDADTAPVGNP